MKIPFIHLIHLNLYEIGPRVGLILDEQLSLTLNRLQRLSLSLSPATAAFLAPPHLLTSSLCRHFSLFLLQSLSDGLAQ
jgi:hypothetical protein